MPLVSIITPTYNSFDFIEKTYLSIKSQTYENWEWLITDDCSSDDTFKFLQKLSANDSRIKISKNEINSGAGVARNKGISIAKGKYIAFLDSDDFWEEDKLKTQITFMEENSIAFSYGNYFEVDDTGCIQHERQTPARLEYNDLLKNCPIGCLTAVYNQEELGKIYMPAIRRGQDWALWLQITKRGEIAYRYPGTLASYTLIKGSLSKNKFKKAFNMYKIYRLQNLNYVHSLYYLLCFTFSKLRK